MIKQQILERRVEAILAESRLARKALNRARQDAREAKERARVARDLQQLAQEVAQLCQTRAHAKLAPIVTRCLQAVFGRQFRFEIEFLRKRGKTEAKLWIIEGKLRLDPMSECSGGVIDVTAYGLRVACLLIQPVRKLLVLDEPFRYVSKMAGYRERVAQLVMTFARELKIQHLIVTHSPALQIGKVVRI